MLLAGGRSQCVSTMSPWTTSQCQKPGGSKARRTHRGPKATVHVHVHVHVHVTYVRVPPGGPRRPVSVEILAIKHIA